jgi:hypothetical protein
MRSISPENQAALAARRLVARDFLWFEARNRSTGATETVGFWSDIENVTAFVINPRTGTPVSRSFYGAGGLIRIDDIPSVSVLQVQDVVIHMDQLDEMVQQAVRLYDLKQAHVEIHRGLLDPVSRQLVSPAIVRFVGFVNTVEITTPAENQNGGVDITCVSHTQEMIRANPATRSHEDQKLRGGDNFFIDAAVVGDWDFEWGAVRGAQKVETRKGLFGWGGFLGFL